MITLKRITENKYGTFGVLLKNDIPFLLTLENQWRFNKRNISCIPVGIYKCHKIISRKFGDSILVKDVPGRTSIIFHAGNTYKDTDGCILVGKNYFELAGIPGIQNSQESMDLLLKEVPDEFDLKIISALYV